MRVLLISDLHGNPWALRAVAADCGTFDYVLCGGDVVNYGPDPGACITWLRGHNAITVCGNHDYAVAHNQHPHANPAKAQLALAMRDWTLGQLSIVDIHWLKRLPLRLTWDCGGTTFDVVHASRMDPLYDYRLTPDLSINKLTEYLGNGPLADVLMVGHTHLPYVRPYINRQLVNPGSVGQPLDGDPRASYAVWEDGTISLRRVEYPVQDVVAALDKIKAPLVRKADLKRVLETGKLF